MAVSVIQNINQSNLEKIESFINDPIYKEALESSANYNTRLCIERRMRLPFLDSQTGVAQNHSSLFMNKRHRMPGLVQGQIYTYPRQRWRKRRRQYLLMNARAFARNADAMLDGDGDLHGLSQSENPALQDTDSKDSQLLKDEEWYYDEQDMIDMDVYDEPDQDSDLDYEEPYSKRTKRRKGAGRGRGGGGDSPSTPGRRKGGGRGRKKATTHNFEPTPGDPDKPFACERTPGRRGRQPNNPPPPATPPQPQAPPTLPPNLPTQPPPIVDDPPMPVLIPEKVIEPPPSSSVEPPREGKAAPSPYCDFCLGDSRENKKTGGSEELVSCSDCGRSGHPTCLQFTDNMKISVKKYRWQCIECKCCSVCGTSDNDDQLLFCDDCDRGYHMYCLSPPLTTPPEGSWSCKLCIDEFHK
ncbi:zinc finger protein ubi-d4 isoform X6 [Onthophagus taurus]|uniref:zinc finger protein ubi-d4 isoform X6 n=1 Tax=Onthophagus taurus TaxID=166361 RepID=UPI000C20A779|nr:zinc finger protein ubi-d4 isoform X6 [Onthophagus taurus]